jgi:hypothetical protein
MGTWGTAISSNDTYADTYSDFMDLYNDGVEVSEITQQLIENNQDLIKDYASKNDFWFALAMAQWDCKSLDKEIFDTVKQIIDSGEDIKLWEEQGADKKDITKREKALTSFVDKISVEKPKAKRRKKKILRDSIFQTGDCLTFRLNNGNYGGAVVLSSEKQTEFGFNMIAVTTINQEIEPSLNDFKKAKVLIQKEQTIPGKYQEREMISWYYAEFYKKCDTEFKVIGQLKVKRTFSIMKDYSSASGWQMIKETIDRDKDFIIERGKPNKKLKLQRLLKKHWL